MGKQQIIITGAAGFISSVLVSVIHDKYPQYDLIGVDDFSVVNKEANFANRSYLTLIDRDHLMEFMNEMASSIKYIFHLGARTDTAEQDVELFDRLNLHYTQKIWNFCSENEIELLYASSAATYGLGECGYDDNHEIIGSLKPLNPYGRSKNDFDIWALQQDISPPNWYGLKFFNVYGPNEYHKSRMASVVFHAYNQIINSGKMNLFMSHRDDIANGHQSRDFVYVKDVVDMCLFFMEDKPESGLYNIGTGTARPFLDLVNAVFKSLDITSEIGFIPTPEDIRDTYQYFTEANMDKIRKAGYKKSFTSLEDGVKDYVQKYLLEGIIM